MSDHRLIAVALDSGSILARDPAISRERDVAIYDLIERNVFRPVKSIARGATGPYRLTLSVSDGRLIFAIADQGERPLETLMLGLSAFRRSVRDYFAICDSYHRAVARGQAAAIETVDMARRALHDDAARALEERLAGRIAVDFATARRLFTLICALHIRG